MDSNQKLNQEEKNSKKITALVIMILTLVIGTTGATYAFFSFSASNSTTITGTAASSDLSLTVSKIKPTTTGSGVMVPQLSYNASATNKNVLKLAVDANCIDANSNQICQVYTIVMQNKSTANVSVSSTLTLAAASGSTFTNLKWYKLAEGTGNTPTTTYTYPASITAKYGNTMSTTALGSNQSIAKNAYYYYVVVVWIEETGSSQNAIDKGTFKATVDVKASNGKGVTSTVTGTSS